MIALKIHSNRNAATVFLVLYFITAMAGTGHKDRLITLSLTDCPLPSALKQIEQLGGKSILFTYSETERYRVTAAFKGKTETEAINIVLYGKPFAYVERNGYFVIQYDKDGAKSRKVTGRVTDRRGHPLAFANIIMLTAESQRYVTGCVTAGDGTFTLPSLPREKCLLKVSFVGYKTATTVCHTDNRIILEEDTRLLEGIVVKADRPMIEHNGGTLTANIAGTPFARLGTADEIISHLPLVNGEDGSYYVIGRGAAEVYVNNRKVRSTAELAQIQADEILSAEVIMNPGARYASTTGAVIRLKTKRRRGEGLSGQATARWVQGRKGSGNEGVWLNYRTGGLDVFMRGYFFENNNYRSYSNNNTMWSSSTWQTRTSATAVNKNTIFRGEIGFNYEPDARQAFGVRYVPGKLLGEGTGKHRGNTTVYRDGDFVEQLYFTSDFTSHTDWSHSVNAYYNATFGRWGIDFNADYYGSSVSQGQTVANNGVVNAKSDNDVSNKLYAAKLVVSYQTDKSSIAVGTEETFTDRRDRFTQSGFSADADDHLRQYYYSVFADYSISWGKFSVTAGLRYEHQRTKYFEAGVLNRQQSPTYNDLLPSLQATYKQGDLSLALAYRMQKFSPSYSMLSSATTYSSKYIYSNGDPNLVPQKHHNISLTGGWKWITLNLWYDYVLDMYTTYFKPYNDKTHPGVMLQTMASIPYTNVYGAAVSLMPTIGPWTPNLQASISWYDAETSTIGITQHWNEPEVSVSLDNNFTFGHGWFVNIFGKYTFYAKQSYAITRPMGYVNLRVSKAFFKDNSLKISLDIDDLLNTRYYPFTAYGDHTYSDNRNHQDYRRIGLTVSYTFNATKNKYRGSGAGQAEKQRL